MNILIQGVGGIGGITAARLVAAGVQVTPVTGNPTIAEALNRHGYRIREADQVTAIPLNRPASATVPDGGGPYDVVFLATQSTALEDAIRASQDQLAPDGVMVCFQNGLPEERAAALLGAERVLGCVVGWGASMVEPGVYVKTSSGGFQLGRLPAGRDEAVTRVEKLLEHVTPVRVTPNLPGVRWSKLAINSAITTLGAVGGDRLGALMKYRFVRRLALEIFSEVVAVAQAEAVQLEKVNGTFDLEKLALTGEERAKALGSPSLFWKHSVLLGIGMKYRRMRSSMLYALERGRKPEVAFLNGEVVRRALEHGIQTPVNSRLIELVGEIAAGHRRSSLAALHDVYRHHRPVGASRQG